ncbi:MAG: hypothetical protein QW156_02920 [Candidatus Aenigmatarchaeota archaeon]
MMEGLKLVLQDNRYLIATIILSVAIGLFFSINMGLLYVTPTIFINHFEFFEGGIFNIILNFLFVFLAPVLASLTIILSFYKFVELKKSIKQEGSAALGGFIASLFISTCQNCVPLVLYSLGVTYGMFVAIFKPFLLPAKILAITILFVSFYFALKGVNTYCKIKTRR